MDTLTTIIEPLDVGKHDRAAFSSGVPALDNYLKQQATQDTKKDIARIYVLCEQPSPINVVMQPILGYYTISSMAVETIQLPTTITRRLPKYEALPAILIGRLAVDQNQRGRRFGEQLLTDALKRCFRLSQQVGTMAVLVDAKDETSARFYLKYGFKPYEDRPLSFYMEMAVIKQIVTPSNNSH